MKLKKLLISILIIQMCLVTFLPIFAQKIKNEKMSVSYEKHGTKPFPINMRTMNGWTTSFADEQIKIDGFKMENSIRSNATMRVFSQKPTIISAKVLPIKYKKDDKELEGFVYTVVAKCYLFIEVTEYFGMLDKLKVYFQKDYSKEITYTTPPATTAEQASNNWFNVHRYTIEPQIKVCALSSLLNGGIREISSTFGSTINRETYYFARITQDKNGTYKAFERANDSTEAILKKVAFKMPYEKEKQRLKPYYDFWIKAKDSLATSEDKTNKNLVFVSCQNACLLSILWDDFETAEKLLQQMEALNVDKSRVKEVKEVYNTKKKERLAFDEHMKRWESGENIFIDAKPTTNPFIVADVVVEDTVEEDFNFLTTKGFLVTRNNDTIFGNLHTIPTELKPNNLFVFVVNQKTKRKILVKDVWSYSTKGIVYALHDNRDDIEYRFDILKYSSEYINLLQDVRTPDFHYFVFRKRKTEENVLPGLGQKVHKAFAHCFKFSCPDLSAEILAEKYKDVQEPYIQLPKILIAEFEKKCGLKSDNQKGFLQVDYVKSLYK